MPRSGLPPFPPFDPLQDQATVGQRWTKWIRRFENLLISLREFDPTVRRGLLLTYVGETANDIFDILPSTGTTYTSAVESLTQYFSPQTNKDVAIFEFRELVQSQNESLNDYYRRLKTKATDCGFANENEEIKTQIIHKTRDPRLRRKALRESMDLTALLSYGTTLEVTDQQAQKLTDAASSNNVVNDIRPSSRSTTQNPRHTRVLRNPSERTNSSPRKGSSKGHNHSPSTRTCGNCGGAFPHKNGRESCPARGKECASCGKIGHFAKWCRSTPRYSSRPAAREKPVHHVSHTTPQEAYLDDSDDDHCFNLNSVTSTNTQPETKILIGNTRVKVLIDSGVPVNILNKNIFDIIKARDDNIDLLSTNAKIRAYGAENPLDLAGEFQTVTATETGKSALATFYVTSGNAKCILGCESSTQLGLLTLNVNNVTQHVDTQVTEILRKHEALFQGTGNLKGVEVKLEIDETVQPVAQPARRIPHSMTSKVNDKLKEMRDEGIIEKVEGATPWLSPLIAIPKKTGNVRLVLDMRIPNTALIRRRVQIPTVDEILRKMEGATIFTEVDLSQGYLQLTSAEESRYITAFPTPEDGPHRFTRLIMGASPSGEHFHEIIHDLIKEIPGVANISDNIWIWSHDKATHLQQLDQLLTKLETSGITLKLPKCSFAVPQINVFGHIVSASGIQPDDKKIKAVQEAPHPTTASEVRSFLGLTNYCSRYIPAYSSLTFPLRQLTKADSQFEWNNEQEQAFQSLKQALTSSPVLAHYSLEAKTRVVVDASPWAVGAVLLQEQTDTSWRPVAYGSRSLTETERKYAQIEKEGLAIVFGCEHFHMYLYG